LESTNDSSEFEGQSVVVISDKVKVRRVMIFEDGNPSNKKRSTTWFGLNSGHTSPGEIIPLKSISLFENKEKTSLFDLRVTRISSGSSFTSTIGSSKPDPHLKEIVFEFTNELSSIRVRRKDGWGFSAIEFIDKDGKIL